MITLTVVAFNGSPADGTLQVRFDELGGSIGRAETNQLVLPDPERVVSRVAAQVVYRNGVFAIVDRGSNPIVLNGRPLASGRESQLAAGDRLGICGYEMKVELGSTGPMVDNDPFASLLGPAAHASSAGTPIVDPLLQPRPATRSAAPPVPAPAAAASGIPDDWDPFGADPPNAGRASAPARPQRDALGLDIGAAAPMALVPGMDAPPTSSASSLDQLFGLGPASGNDPFAASVLAAPMAQPNMAADADPLRSLKSAPKASGASESDQLSDLNRPFIPPPGIKTPQPVRPQPVAPAGPIHRAAAAAVGPPGARVQMPRPAAPPDSMSRTNTAPMAATPRVVAPPMVAPPMVAPPMAAPPLVAAPARPAAAAPVVAARGAATTEDAALLDALRRGLEVPALEVPALTPALMEAIGQMLREAVRGTMEQLRARPPVKQGLRTGAAGMPGQSANPLRFSPDAGVALRHLLAPPARGALAAGPALRDAQDDLRAQQIALVAVAQAALDDALHRLEPAAIEGEFGSRSTPLSLLPASRHARLWDAYVANYTAIRQGASNEFRGQFARAFMEACDEHRKRSPAALDRERPEGKR